MRAGAAPVRRTVLTASMQAQRIGGRPARVIRHSVLARSGRGARRTARAARRGTRAAPRRRAAGVRSTRQRPQREVSHVEHAERQRQVAAGEPDPVAGAVVDGVAVRRRRVTPGERGDVAGVARRGSRRPSPARRGRRPRGRSGTPPASRRPLEHARARIATAPSQTAVTSLDRARSPTRRRGTQSRGGAPAVARIDAQLQQPEPSGRRRTRALDRARARPAAASARVVVEEEQQVAARRAARRRCGRPGCRASSASPTARTPSGRPAGVPAVADDDDVELDAALRQQRARARAAARPGARPWREHDAAERRHRSRLGGEDRDQVPGRGQRRRPATSAIDQHARAGEVAGDRVDDRRRQRQQRGLDRHERAEERREPGQPPQPRAARCARRGHRGACPRPAAGRTRRARPCTSADSVLDQQHEHGGQRGRASCTSPARPSRRRRARRARSAAPPR